MHTGAFRQETFSLGSKITVNGDCSHDRGGWQATAHGLAKSRTHLRAFFNNSSNREEMHPEEISRIVDMLGRVW